MSLLATTACCLWCCWISIIQSRGPRHACRLPPVVWKESKHRKRLQRTAICYDETQKANYRAKPLLKLQNNTSTTVQRWKMRCRILLFTKLFCDVLVSSVWKLLDRRTFTFHRIRGCAFGGVYVPCIYILACKMRACYALLVFVVVLMWRLLGVN